MTLPEKLLQLRKERDWTQKEVAKKAGLDRAYISYLEQPKNSHVHPSAEALSKLARAYNIRLEELYEAAGYIKPGAIPLRPETPDQILDRLRLATPISIPVYSWEAFPFRAGDDVEVEDYVYISRRKIANRHVEAYIVRGNCLEPKVNDGDVIVVDRDAAIDNGDIVACLVDDQLHVLRVHKVADQIWLENNYKKYKFEECQHCVPVIECIRRLK